MSIGGKTFLDNKELHHEVFGPISLIIKCDNVDELLQVATSIEGQLTATIMDEEPELLEYTAVIDVLQRCAGCLLFNGVPVEWQCWI